MPPFAKTNQPLHLDLAAGAISISRGGPTTLSKLRAGAFFVETQLAEKRFRKSTDMQGQADYQVVVDAPIEEVVTSSADFVLAVALFRAAIPKYRLRVIELRQGATVIRRYLPP